MKLTTVLVSVSLCAASLAFSQKASADDQLAVSLCEYVAADDKSALRKKLKSSRVKIRNVFDAIQCNGNNLLRHAIASNAADTGEFIVKNLPKSVLEDGADIAWAEGNGHGGSPIIAAIKDRAGL
ncbi:DUF3718 domain-containing protein [Pseudoalteromonas sp. MMG022]|uniref:DUF3718 domain-containing protein n=1 Tax=Pseudoalteromonas sp. MMG022 TaxID=2909978 RepID=UPI001F34A623|nr:DUF3718 domain-containing protein [Pseudoalteromonas sp. MMG022]MCF6435428.1 DUF3718 domain-containing protein [Pseudoalteromonas sp. MMG022]